MASAARQEQRRQQGAAVPGRKFVRVLMRSVNGAVLVQVVGVVLVGVLGHQEILDQAWVGMVGDDGICRASIQLSGKS